SSGDVWAQTQHGTCNSSAHATGFDRALTYSPPFVVRAHQTTKEDCTPGTLKASQVALVEPVAYLKDLVNREGWEVDEGIEFLFCLDNGRGKSHVSVSSGGEQLLTQSQERNVDHVNLRCVGVDKMTIACG